MLTATTNHNHYILSSKEAQETDFHIFYGLFWHKRWDCTCMFLNFCSYLLIFELVTEILHAADICSLPKNLCTIASALTPNSKQLVDVWFTWKISNCQSKSLKLKQWFDLAQKTKTTDCHKLPCNHNTILLNTTSIWHNNPFSLLGPSISDITLEH